MITAQFAALLVLASGLAGCAPATDWSSLATPRMAYADGREAGIAAGVAPTRSAPVASGGDGFSLCEAAVRAAEMREQIPAGLLGAIARVESGRPDPRSQVIRPWPWSIDVDGKSRFFADRAQAVAGVQQALAAGAVSVDVGCMQVNLQYHPAAFRSLQEAFDPVANTAYAARFLKSLWSATPDRQWMAAAGYYHSRTPDLAAEYRRQVQGSGGTGCPSRLVPIDTVPVVRPPGPLVVACNAGQKS